MISLRTPFSAPVNTVVATFLFAVSAACSGTTATKAPAAANPPSAQPLVERPAPSAASVAGTRPPPGSLDSLSLPDLLATLRARAESGADPELADHVDLLEAIERHGIDASEKVAVRRAKEVEQAVGSKWKDGTAYCTVTCYLEPGADVERMRRVYLSYDRYPEWTGRSEVRLLSREGDDAIVFANGERSGPFGLKFGATWRFRAHPIVRGRALINVVRMLPAPETEHMRETRSLLVAFPEGDGTHVVEAAVADVDFDSPPLLGGIALSIATKDVRERAGNLRSRWSELPSGPAR